MHLRSQSLPHHARRAGKLDDRAARRDVRHVEALRREPIGDRLEVGIRRAKLLPELLGRQPLVEAGGGLHLLVIKQLPQGGFLVGAALQDQQDSLQGQVVRRHALVKFPARQRVDVSRESDQVVRVHCLRHAGASGGALRQRVER